MIVTQKALQNNNVTLEEVCLLRILHSTKSTDLTEIIQSLFSKYYISAGIKDNINPNKVFITNTGYTLLDKVFTDSKLKENDNIDYEDLVTKMQAIFPQGKKPNTNFYWRGNVATNVTRLKKIFKLSNYKYTPEQVLIVTKKYVESFNGVTTYMQLLQYFISKEDTTTKSINSELLSQLENYDENDTEILINTDWTVNLK